MFVLRDGSTFDWKVKASVPENGKRRPLEFDATFRLLDSDTIDELVANPETRDTKKFLERALVRFTGFRVEDENGDEVTDDQIKNDMICKSPLFIEPLLDAYAAGAVGHKAKN